MIRQEILHSLSNYLIESGVSLAVWSIVYLIVLRRNNSFLSNRYFLLMGLLISTMVPFFQFSLHQIGALAAPESMPAAYSFLLDSVVVTGKGVAQAVENEIISSGFWVVIYLTGLLILFSRLLLWMWQISKLIRTSRLIKSKENTFVLVDHLQTPYSFLWYIFVHPDFASKGKDYRTMVTHELEHVKQGHTYDVLMLELLSILQWFNPFVWLLRKAVRENHEFLADRAVIEAGISIVEYKTLLLHQSTGGSFMATSHFNKSLVKNRLRMMAQSKVPRLSIARFLAAIALALTASFVYASEFAGEKPVETRIDLEFQPETYPSVPIRLEDKEPADRDEKLHGNTLVVAGGAANDVSDVIPEQGTSQSQVGNSELITNQNVEQDVERPADVFFIVEEMPMFPGGEDALRAHIATSIQYPASALERGVSGRVYISFVVSASGSVEAVKVARGVDALLDEEAVRVVSELPEWIPGRQRGVAVAVAYTVPISFTIE